MSEKMERPKDLDWYADGWDDIRPEDRQAVAFARYAQRLQAKLELECQTLANEIVLTEELEARIEKVRGGLAAIRALPASTNISQHLDTLDYILRGEDSDE